MSAAHTSPRLLTATEYARDLTRKIKAAESRICIISTTFHADDPLSTAVVDALADAAARGVKVSIGADSFTYIEPKGSILTGAKKHSSRAINAHRVQRRLSKDGVEFQWLGRMSNLVFAGRTHTKWAIVDDIVYSFGGVNLDHVSFTNADYMIRFQHHVLAERLADEHRRILKADRANHASRSHKLVLDEQNTILIDGGVPGDSVIYRRACTLAKEASEVTLVSQYCPTGRLSRILKRKSAVLYFNHWRKARWVNMLIIQAGMIISRQSTLYNRRLYLHSKFIIYTAQDKSRVALSGSHNYTNSGVIVGTREIALETRDPELIDQLAAFLDKHVK